MMIFSDALSRLKQVAKDFTVGDVHIASTPKKAPRLTSQSRRVKQVAKPKAKRGKKKA